MKIQVDNDLELRQLNLSDSLDIFHTIDSHRNCLGKWLPFVELTKELEDTEKFVSSVVNAPEDCFNYVFTIRKQDEFIGLVGFRNTDKQNQKTEIGYWLSPAYQKRGIMIKSVAKLCNFAFNEQGINRIEIRCAVENKASRKIPEQLNFKLEGIERDGELLSGSVFTDLAVYSKLKHDIL